MKMTIAATLAQELCNSAIGCLCLYFSRAKKTLNPSMIKVVPKGGLERYIPCISIIRTYCSITSLILTRVPLISNSYFLFSLEIKTETF